MKKGSLILLPLLGMLAVAGFVSNKGNVKDVFRADAEDGASFELVDDFSSVFYGAVNS